MSGDKIFLRGLYELASGETIHKIHERVWTRVDNSVSCFLMIHE